MAPIVYKQAVTRELSHLVVVANRLPYVIERREGSWRTRPASGGLVTALSPVLRDSGGTWVGWGGTLEEDEVDPDPLLQGESADAGFTLKSVVLSQEEHDRFYLGFSNEVIWPLFHTLDERCNFAPAYWDAYKRVNEKFAAVVRDTIARDSFIWVHDYHFMLLGHQMRALGVKQSIGFFLHIPFPPLEIFLKLPWRLELLTAMLAYDIIGFQTLRDRRNFIHCVRALQRSASASGRGRDVVISTRERNVHAGVFPISIDFREFAEHAASPKVVERVRRLRTELDGRQMLLGLDRLDYTKGIPMRLRAFRRLLRNHPELHRKIRFVQIVIPSREVIPSYRQLKAEVEELVGEINGEFTDPGWVPVHYTFRSLSRDELLAYYRLADVGVVTPLNDGMNLVAKEYCAANVEEQGVLVLSEFAGAAAELRRAAVLVNPYDIVGMAEAMVHAIGMPSEERKARMARLRRTIQQHDVHHWVRQFLDAAKSVQVLPPRAQRHRANGRNGSGPRRKRLRAPERTRVFRQAGTG